jgi:pSer/pThr/pTyr-binding forkhead associated (FHA) protein
MPVLKMISDTTSRFILLQKGTTRIGRSSESQLAVRSPVVSKLHAIVECYDDRCTLENRSANGTLVNGHRLNQIATLRHGDQIQVGMSIFVFLEDDHTEDDHTEENGTQIQEKKLTDTADRLVKVVAAQSPDPDASIRRKSVKPGSSVTRCEIEGVSTIDPGKIRGCVSLRERALPSLATTDSVRKLSQVLRFSESIRHYVLGSGLQVVFDSIHQLFPQATQIVLVSEFSEDMKTYRVLGTSCDDGSESALICDDVIHRVATRSECLLVSDQWRNVPTEKPRLSKMGRISLLCVPMRTHCGKCCGVLQVIGTAPRPEFEIADLERLAILAQLLTIVLPQP